MRTFFRTITIFILALSALISCSQDSTLRYNNRTMCKIAGTDIISDQGLHFNVVENEFEGNYEEMTRALIICDILEKKDDKTYDIRLRHAFKALDKAPVTKEAADADEEMAVADPIMIENIWISGGYINMYVILQYNYGSSRKHLVNLVLDESQSQDGSYVFTLRHNSYGESSIYEAPNLKYGSSYLSFRIADIIDEETADITINWTHFTKTGPSWSSTLQDSSISIGYRKGGYEHAPYTSESSMFDSLD